jgi:hypothetical protein
MAIRAVDAYLVYQTVKRLTTPFKNWDAYKAGIIDERGNVLKKRSTLTPDEQQSWGYFDILTANLKKLLSKVPGGSSRLATIAAAAYLLKEHKQDHSEQIDQQLLEEYIASLTTITEQRIDKHEVSGKVVIDGHVFSDAGKSGRSTYGRYSVKDPNYKKDPDEVGMHRNYRKPTSLSFSTMADAKKWVKTQPKKSKEEVDRIHKKHADFEDYMNEEAPANAVGGGNVAGIGVGDQGEPGVYKRRRARTVLATLRRKFKQEGS